MLRASLYVFLAFATIVVPLAGLANAEDPLQALRQQLEKLRNDYESRIDALEKRIEDAEKAAQGAQTSAAVAEEKVVAVEKEGASNVPPDAVEGTSGALSRAKNYFNPQISVVLQGLYSEFFNGDDGTFLVPGVLTGEGAGPPAEGLSLGESELVLSANADDKLYGYFNVAFEVEDGDSNLEVEEAYLETLALPMGLNVRGGQFFSAVGHHNAIHSHAWDFVDAPLVYESFLGTAYIDPGARISWIAPTDLYLELGGEYFRGDNFPSGGGGHDGRGAATAFAVLAGDLDESNSWKLGLSYLSAEPRNRANDIGGGSRLSFSGDSDVLIADLVWKWAPFGNLKNRYFVFQSEYLWRHEDGSLLLDDSIPGAYEGDQHGVYAQGVYQFYPRWRIGLRYGLVFSDNEVQGIAATLLDDDSREPWRISTMIDFSNSEFSRFRLQYALQEGGLRQDHMLFFQYIVSLGSHGAHPY